MNELKEGQIYTLNDGETYDIIHDRYYDGSKPYSGDWCYEIVVMKDILNEAGQVILSGGGFTIDWEDCAIEEIREKGVLVGQIGETHFFNPENKYRLEEIKTNSFIDKLKTVSISSKATPTRGKK